MTETTQDLKARLENLRETDPALWAIVRGRGSLAKIGLVAGLSPKDTKERVADLASEGIIYEGKMPGVYYLNMNSPMFGRLRKLRRLNEIIETKWLEEGADVNKVDVASSVMQAWKLAHPELASTSRVVRFDEEVTQKQAEVLVTLSGLGPRFRPLDLARAQGYTAAGFSKNTLVSLSKKKFVEEVIERPSTWMLTKAGVEKAEELKRKGVKPAQKDGVTIDPEEV